MADNGAPCDGRNFKLVLTYDIDSKAFSMTGHAENFLVAQGMLTYAEQMLRMEIAKQRVAGEMQNAPRIKVSSRLVE